MNTLISRFALASLVASSAFAQTFNPNIGVSQGVGPATNDTIVSNVPVGFNFTFPGGTVTSTVDIDTNGRILLPDPANVSLFLESIADFTSTIPMICPMWDDVDFEPTNGQIYVNSTATQCTITWCQAKKFGGSFVNPFTFQAQLNSDDSIAFVYDESVIAEQWITGVSGGPPAFDPGEVDLSAGAALAGIPIVYEEFAGSGNRFDLTGGGVLFTPDGSGGYTVTSTSNAGVTPCGAERFGRPCPVSFQFFPNGMGGFTVLRGPSQFVIEDTGFAPTTEWASGGLPLGDDLNAGPIPLGFMFPWPGGMLGDETFADNNGRIMFDNTDGGDFNPSVSEFLNGPPSISGWWTDLSAQRGSLRSWQGPNSTTLTWDSVPKFAENVTHTFQIALYPDGRFDLNYSDVALWQTNASFTSDDVLIGCTEGGGAIDPGSTDFSTSTFDSGMGATIYEFWDANNFPPMTPDIHTKLEVVNGPFQGQNFELNMTGISSAGFGATLLFGFTPFDAPLGFVFPALEGCSLYTDPVLTIPLTQTGSTANFSLAIGMSPSLRGLTLVTQGAVFAPDTTIGLVLTNAARGTVQ